MQAQCRAGHSTPKEGNTKMIFTDRMVLKFYRHVWPGRIPNSKSGAIWRQKISPTSHISALWNIGQ